jgi:hypothetical protein
MDTLESTLLEGPLFTEGLECPRRCADRSFRNRWDPALPVPGRREK